MHEFIEIVEACCKTGHDVLPVFIAGQAAEQQRACLPLPRIAAAYHLRNSFSYDIHHFSVAALHHHRESLDRRLPQVRKLLITLLDNENAAHNLAQGLFLRHQHKIGYHVLVFIESVFTLIPALQVLCANSLPQYE